MDLGAGTTILSRKCSSGDKTKRAIGCFAGDFKYIDQGNHAGYSIQLH